jgi:hypothetical protein
MTAPADERALAQAPAKAPLRFAVVLLALHRGNILLSATAARWAGWEPRPPPLLAGSPAQARLHIWII